jgi:hypothetical protein
MPLRAEDFESKHDLGKKSHNFNLLILFHF